MSFMISTLAMVVLNAIAIGVVGGLSKTFVVKDFGSAVLAAFVMTIVAWVVPVDAAYGAIASVVFGPVEPHVDPTGLAEYTWLFLGGFLFIINTLLLFVVALVTPGIELRGVFGLVVAAAVLTIVDMLAPRLLL
jgi:uncharacterized membrane protein YvlD (DUF360 family)